MPLLVSLSLAGLLATLVAVAVTFAPSTMQNSARRVFLVIWNLNPWGFDLWRDRFSGRETFLAVWFLTFVVTLVVGAFVSSHGHAHVTF
jgi:hypothetical protein